MYFTSILCGFFVYFGTGVERMNGRAAPYDLLACVAGVAMMSFSGLSLFCRKVAAWLNPCLAVVILTLWSGRPMRRLGMTIQRAFVGITCAISPATMVSPAMS